MNESDSVSASVTGELQETLGMVEELEASLKKYSAKKKNQCMKAIGDSSLCNCIVGKAPAYIDFIQYVAFTSLTKEELKYDKMTQSDRQLVDAARSARDKCISWSGKVNDN